MRAVYDLARSRGERFAETIFAVYANPSILPKNHRTRLSKAITGILQKLNELFPEGANEDYGDYNQLSEMIGGAAEKVIADSAGRNAAKLELRQIAEAFRATTIKALVGAVGIGTEGIEQQRELDKVNILTMHRAKGLTAEAVIIPAAEHEHLPGTASGEAFEDERRLLYVSLTRARHYLYVTFCNRRTGQQSYSGSNSGQTVRNLSEFLVDAPFVPKDGTAFVSSLPDGTTQ